MSKSAESDASRINLLDEPDVIVRKIKRCKTDAFEGRQPLSFRPVLNLVRIGIRKRGATRV